MIKVDGLTKRYARTVAVDNISFEVEKGQIVGFLGPNGAGKTTTMRVLLGLDAPTSGSALIGGRRYQSIIRPLHQVGSLLDATALHPGRTAAAHVTSIAQSNGIGRRRATEVLALTAEHLIIIGRGRLLADMPTAEFIEASARGDVLVRSPRPGDLARLLTAHGAAVAPEGDGGLAVSGMDAPAIAGLAAGHDIPVHELTPRHASLEQAYLDITKDSVEYRARSQAGEGTVAR